MVKQNWKWKKETTDERNICIWKPHFINILYIYTFTFFSLQFFIPTFFNCFILLCVCSVYWCVLCTVYTVQLLIQPDYLHMFNLDFFLLNAKKFDC